jgi:hypothetical protein
MRLLVASKIEHSCDSMGHGQPVANDGIVGALVVTRLDLVAFNGASPQTPIPRRRRRDDLREIGQADQGA